MDAFLRNIKIIQDFRVNLPIEEDVFIQRFQERIKESDLGLMSDPFEVYTTHGPDYKGWMQGNEFALKRCRRMFRTSTGLAKVSGTYREEGQHIVLEGEVNAAVWWLGLLFGVAIVIYLAAIIFFMSSGTVAESDNYLVLLLFVHALFVMGLPYFFLRREVDRIVKDLKGGLFR